MKCCAGVSRNNHNYILPRDDATSSRNCVSLKESVKHCTVELNPHIHALVWRLKILFLIYQNVIFIMEGSWGYSKCSRVPCLINPFNILKLHSPAT